MDAKKSDDMWIDEIFEKALGGSGEKNDSEITPSERPKSSTDIARQKRRTRARIIHEIVRKNRNK